MSSLDLSSTFVPPATPTLTFTPKTSITSASASSFTILDANASVDDGGNSLGAIRVSLGTGTGSLGVADNGFLKTLGTVGTISYQYDSTRQVLSLTDNTAGQTASSADFTQVLKLVAYNAGSTTIGASQDISVNLGRPIFSSANGHYYEFITYDASAALATKTWTVANGAASRKNFLGLTGYLATVTSASENKFMNDRIKEQGWIGGGSAGTTGTGRVWQWVVGPENGTIFWNGNQNGAAVAGQYTNWAAGEPNNSLGAGTDFTLNNEPYAHFFTNGTWNDFADNNTSLQGYWVEYSTATGIGSDGLEGTRKTFNVTVENNLAGTKDPAALDLVFYDPANGQLSFAFVGTDNNIVSTPNLTYTPTPATSSAIGGNWNIISANVDVDGDGFKDLIFRNTTGKTEVLVAFGEPLNLTGRANYYTRFATVEYAGSVLSVPSFTVDIASQQLGADNKPALLWRDAASGIVVVGNLIATTTGGTTKVTHQFSNGFNIGAGSTWRAVGDGEFNDDTNTREVIWTNDVSGGVITWSLNNNRSILNSWSALSYLTDIVNVGPLASSYKVIGVANIDGIGNDEIVWQKGTSTIIWKMKDRLIDGSISVLNLSSPDRLKAIADVNKDGVLDLIGQNDTDGTVGFYTLTAALAEGADRVTYTAGRAAYKPGRGAGNAGLELVNVSQYDTIINVA